MSRPLQGARAALPHTGAARPATHVEVAATVLCAVAVLLVVFDAVVLTLSLPRVAADLGCSGAGVVWVVTGYVVALLAWFGVAAAITDRVGARRSLVAGLAGFAVASGVCAIATTAPVLAGARIAQGTLAGLVLAGAVATLATATRSQARVRGTVISVVVLGAVAGPPLGALLTGTWGWRIVFAVEVPVGVALILLAVATGPGRIPYAFGSRIGGVSWRVGPAVLGFVAMTAVVAAVSYARVWPGPLSWIVLLAGIAGLAVLVLQARSPYGMGPGTDVGAWFVVVAGAGSGLAALCGTGVSGYLVSAALLMTRPGEVTWLPGLGCAGAIVAAAIAAALVSGRTPTRTRLAVVAAFAVAATTAGFLVVDRDIAGTPPRWWAWTVAVACVGAGIGCAAAALGLIDRGPSTAVDLDSTESGQMVGGQVYGVIGAAGLGAALTRADLLSGTVALWAHLAVTAALTGVFLVATTHRARPGTAATIEESWP